MLLGDDHPVVAGGLLRFLNGLHDMVVSGTAESYEEVNAKLIELRPDVLVLDLNMPGMKGAESVREIVAQKGTRIVVFSMHDEDEVGLTMLKAGARSYLTKTRDPSELAHAIRTVHRGHRYITPELSELMLTGDNQSAVHDAFSRRERQVFDLLARGLAPKQIAADLNVSSSTVHTYTERIKNKLGVDTLTQVVSYAYQHRLI